MTTNKSTNDKNILVYKIDFFYKLFDVKKTNNFPELDKKKKRFRLDFKTYRLIISTFLGIYFREVFYLKKDYYFFLSGKVIKCCNKKYINFEDTFINDNISFVWYDRPLTTLRNRIVLAFARGTTCHMAILRQQYMKDCGIEGLPTYKKLYGDLIKANLIYTK